MPVTVTQVVQKDVPLDVSVVGTVEAYSTVAVRAQITGELTAVHFQEGDDVQEGQVLFTLDRRPLEAALQQAQANLAARYRAGRERARDRAAHATIWPSVASCTREQGDTARTTVAGARRHARRRSRGRREREGAAAVRHDRAPISGRTGALMVNAGNLVRANDQAPLVIINQVTPIYVSFAVPGSRCCPSLRRYLAQGVAARRSAPAERRRPAPSGRITFVDNAVDQTTGTIKVKATFPNDDRRLWPGQFVNVVVRLATESGRDRRADACRADRSGGPVRVRRQTRSDRGDAAGHGRA